MRAECRRRVHGNITQQTFSIVTTETRVRHRLQEILVAYFLASFAASFAIALRFVGEDLLRDLFLGHWQRAAAFPFSLFWIGGIAGLFICLFAFLPAVSVIGLTEIARIRSALFYGVAGGCISLPSTCLWGRWSFPSMDGSSVPDARSITQCVSAGLGSRHSIVFVAAGVIGGLVYWRLAGKNADDWRGRDVTA